MIFSDSWTWGTQGGGAQNLSENARTTGAKTHRPMCELFVGKTIYRQDGGAVAAASYEGGGAWDDLAWYLGDGGSVSIQKSIYKPCGSFVVTIPDQPVAPTVNSPPADSLHALLEPVDGLNLYLARDAHQYIGGHPPIMMRGFVRDIVRQEQMGRDGKPHRVTKITGQDYGAVFDFLRLWMISPALLQIPDFFKALYAVGVNPGPKPVAEFYQYFIDFANKYLDGLFYQGGHPAVLGFACSVEGLIPQIGLNVQEGPLWGLMLREQDSPWNELFIEERDDNPYLVYRPAPWKGIDGNYIPTASGATPSAYTASIDIADIVSLTTHRSDYDAANLFWINNAHSVQSGLSATVMSAFLHGNQRELIQDDGHQNNDRTILGDRAVTTDFRHFPPDTRDNPTTAKEEPWKHNEITLQEFWAARLDWLRLVNRDNTVFENGVMTVKGSEHIRPGMYLRVVRGSFEWECYVTSVTHEFVPLQQYTTTVEFIRGTGFYNRLKSGRSPYLREGRRGPYDSQ